MINNNIVLNAGIGRKEQLSEEYYQRLKLFSKDLAAGGVAGAISRTIVSPLERLKILFQLDRTPNGHVRAAIASGKPIPRRGIWGSLVRIYQVEGVLGYFKGNGTNVIRIVPYSAVQFATYEGVKRLLTRNIPVLTDDSTLLKLISGAFAGTASVMFTYPLDLVRTRLSLPNNHSVNRGISYCMRQVYVHEGGLLALYRGLVPTVVGIAPYVALNFTTYESLKRILSERQPDDHELPVLVRLGCGGVAGAVAQSCTYPLDVIRRRMQVAYIDASHKANIGWIELAQLLYRTDGIIAFYRGILPNLLKVIPAISTSFVTYEYSKSFLDKMIP